MATRKPAAKATTKKAPVKKAAVKKPVVPKVILSKAQFAAKINTSEHYFTSYASNVPCFAHRWYVPKSIKTMALAAEYVEVAANAERNDVLIFSVTQQEKEAWEAFKALAKAKPRLFKMVEGGSIHGKYLGRMYIYTKPQKSRKYPDLKA